MKRPTARKRSGTAGWIFLVIALPLAAFPPAVAAGSTSETVHRSSARAHPLRKPSLDGPAGPAAAIEPLWPQGAPGALGRSQADQPFLTVYPPDPGRGVGTAVIVCPGGAYGMLARQKEGVEPSLWLKSQGVHAFQLDYRVGPAYHHPVELWDAQRAVRWVRANAKRFGIDPRRIGMLGFSAGGHLTALVSTRNDDGDAHARDSVERVSCRPDFQMLIYPVISMQAPFTHRASRINLLGRHSDPATLDSLSPDAHVDDRTPPAFIVHAEGDPIVAFANSRAYAEALRNARVPVEFLGFVQGGHAFGLAQEKNGEPGQAQLATWPSQCAAWLMKMGFLGAQTDLRPNGPHQ
jgi:acetyl esterase/lipase